MIRVLEYRIHAYMPIIVSKFARKLINFMPSLLSLEYFRTFHLQLRAQVSFTLD